MAERQEATAETRPLVFICHGFGGLLLQRALALTSESNSTPLVFQTLRSSTYGIIFAGTPHRGIYYDALRVLYHDASNPPNQLILDLIQGSDMLREVSSFFQPMLRDFHIINFWEQLQTDNANASAFIVEEKSAAPMLYSLERWGITSDHATLLTFSSPQDPGFMRVNNALESFFKESSLGLHRGASNEYEEIALSRTSAQPGSQGHNMWQNEITGRAVHLGDVYIYNTIQRGNTVPQPETVSVPSLLDMYGRNPTSSCQMYKVDRRSSPQFTGRRLQAEMLLSGLASPASAENRDKHKIAVMYGLGGSGKTQFCLRFAEQHQAKYGIGVIEPHLLTIIVATGASFGSTQAREPMRKLDLRL